MHRISARIIFLAGLLLQGVYTVRADQPPQGGLTGRGNSPLPEAKMAIGSMNNQQSFWANANQVKDSRPKANPNLISPPATQLNKKLSNLKAPNNLFLPLQPNQVTTSALHPLTLEEVQELVEVNNPKLKSIEIQVEQDKSLLLAAISKWYPTANLTANGLPQYFSIEQSRNPDFGSDTSGQQWQASLSLQVKWNLIDPARVPEIAAARDTYEKAKLSYFIALRDIRLEAISRYFLLQKADQGVRIGKDSIRASLLSLRDAKARFEAGVATRLEVLQAETQLARDKQLLTSKLGDQNINRRLLSGLLNLPPNTSITASSPAQVVGIWTKSLQESITSALAFREELNQILLNISINNSNANFALASIQPVLSIFNTLTGSTFKGQTGVTSSNSVDMEDYGSSISNSVGVSATWNIFDGGRAKSLYRYNKQRAKEGEAAFALQRNNIRQEVEQSFFNLRTANQDIATSTREVIASREALRLARLRFQAGVATQREVVNSQRDLTQAEVRYSNAITTYNISLAELRRRTGIDHIKACKPERMPNAKPQIDEVIDFQIEPFPLIPACQASTITNKE